MAQAGRLPCRAGSRLFPPRVTSPRPCSPSSGPRCSLRWHCLRAARRTTAARSRPRSTFPIHRSPPASAPCWPRRLWSRCPSPGTATRRISRRSSIGLASRGRSGSRANRGCAASDRRSTSTWPCRHRPASRTSTCKPSSRRASVPGLSARALIRFAVSLRRVLPGRDLRHRCQRRCLYVQPGQRLSWDGQRHRTEGPVCRRALVLNYPRFSALRRARPSGG